MGDECYMSATQASSRGERFFDELEATLGIDQAGFQVAIIKMLNPEQVASH